MSNKGEEEGQFGEGVILIMDGAMDGTEEEKGRKLEAHQNHFNYSGNGTQLITWQTSRLYRFPVVVLLIAVSSGTSLVVKLGMQCSLQVVNQNSAIRHHKKCKEKHTIC